LRNTVHSNWRVRIVIVGLGTTLAMTVPDLARAQGLFDFFFDIFQSRSPPQPQQNAYPAPPPTGLGRIAPVPLGQESVTERSGSTGHSVAFCVRLCDGQHFPLEQLVNGTPAETCRAICPYSKTKVFLVAKSAPRSHRTGNSTPLWTARFCTAGNWWRTAPATGEMRSDWPRLM